MVNTIDTIYTLVDENLNKLITNSSKKKQHSLLWCFRRINRKFSKALNKQSLNIPSRQHKLNEEYYERVEAIQFTMRHDDGNDVKDIEESDIILFWRKRNKQNTYINIFGQ